MVDFDALVKGLMGQGATKENAERLARRKLGGAPSSSHVRVAYANLTIENGTVVEQHVRSFVSIGSPPIATRRDDSLELVLLFPPRTKKNSKENYGTQSLGYRKFKHAVVRHIRSFADELGLPLPDQFYNCKALFVTDTDRADTQGLIQGLSDALQDAGVVSDDRFLIQWDGTRQVFDAARARIELSITPVPR